MLAEKHSRHEVKLRPNGPQHDKVEIMPEVCPDGNEDGKGEYFRAVPLNIVEEF